MEMGLTERELRLKNDMEYELGTFNIVDPNALTDPLLRETPLMEVNITSDPLNYSKLLIKMGADPNIIHEQLGSALHYAVANENPDTTRYLLSVGANPFVKDGDGETPYDLAMRNGHIIEADILKNHMIRKIQNKQLRRMTRKRAKTMRRLATAKSMLEKSNITYGNPTYSNPMSHMDYDTMSYLMSNYLM